MTNKEALIANVGFSVPDNMVEKAMIDNDVTGSETYVKANAESVDLCTIPILQRVLSEPDVAEGGYKINFDRSAVQARLDTLLDDYEIKAGPTVTGKSVW